jgi:hypothetical protein
MRETIELRISEEDARRHLPRNVGRVLGGSVRRVDLALSDPLLDTIRAVERRYRARNDVFFTWWTIHRRYTQEELESAEVLQLEVGGFFEHAGEECGTVYDESASCPSCGFGRTQVSTLMLSRSKLRQGKDLSISVASEIVVSGRLADALREQRFTGFSLRPIDRCGRPGSRVDGWEQLVVEPPYLPAVDPTSFGEDPLVDGEDPARCPFGHVAGLNLLSELSISRAAWSGADLAATEQAVGRRVGYLVPSRLLVLSPRLYRFLRDGRYKGSRVEVAYLR